MVPQHRARRDGEDGSESEDYNALYASYVELRAHGHANGQSRRGRVLRIDTAASRTRNRSQVYARGIISDQDYTYLGALSRPWSCAGYHNRSRVYIGDLSRPWFVRGMS